MAYRVVFSFEAQRHLKSFAAREQRLILARIEARLITSPAAESRSVKELRSNPLARFELRVGEFRVFFDPDEADQVVRVLAIGRKQHNRLMIGDKEVRL
jgi:mRNA-degrading endonuclease RelE of RelBE toxin-antitoxin system